MAAQASKAARARWHRQQPAQGSDGDQGDDPLMPPRVVTGDQDEQAPKPSIIEFAMSPRYLGLSLSLGQKTLLKTAYGEVLDPEELQAFQLCTGRSTDPRTSFRNLVVVAGARAGKDSRLVAPIALFEMAFGGHKVAKGERATVAIFAQDATAAGVTYRYIRDYLIESPDLARLLVGKPMRAKIELSNRFEIRTFATTAPTARAYSIAVGILNEAAFFRLSGSVNADTEILASVRRGMVGFATSKLLIVSTPFAKSGIVYDHFQRFYGRDDSMDVLVWRSPASFMNSSITAERLAEEQRVMDPQQFAREFLAEFIDDASAWLPGDLIEAAVDTGIVERPYNPEHRYTMAIDASGAGSCGFAVSVCHEERAEAVRVVIQDLGRVWMKPPSGEMNLDAIVREILRIAEDYHVRFAWSDRYAGAWPKQRFEAVSQGRFTLKDPTIRRNAQDIYLHKSDAFFEVAPLFRTGCLRLLDLPRQTREFRNLEARPMEGGRMRISKPPVRSELDDQATALATGAAMLVTAKQSFMSITWSHNKNTHLGAHQSSQYRDPRLSDDPITFRRSDRGDERIEDNPAAHDINNETHRFECGICRAKWKAQ